MTIAVSAQNFFTKQPTGVDFYVREIVKNLSEICEADDEIIVYVKNLPQDIQDEAAEFLRLQKVSFRELKFKKLFNLFGIAFEVYKKNFDAVFCPSSVTPLFGNKNIIAVIHGLEFKNCPEGYSFLNKLWMNFSTRLSLFLSHKIIVPSLATKNDIIKFYKTNPSKIFVINHGPVANFKLFESFSGQKNIEQILFLGRVEKRKNLEILIEAFEKIYTKFFGASLIIAGKNGFGAEKILSKIKKSPAQNRIFLEGYVDEKKKRDLLSSSGILVFPSNAEGFGFPVLEGQAAKCAVICSDLEVLKEIADGGALFFKRQDSDDLAQKLLDIMMNDTARSQLILNGAKNLERFSWKESAWQTYNIIKNNGNGKD
jgi:glycosyltransferase involved in cell wall biosynthesis